MWYARNNRMDSHIELINYVCSQMNDWLFDLKEFYAISAIFQQCNGGCKWKHLWYIIWKLVHLPLILNVGDWRMEKGIKSGWGCQVSFHHRSLTLQCRHFDFRTDKSHLTLLQEQRQNKIQNTKTAYFTSTKAIEWSSRTYL